MNMKKNQAAEILILVILAIILVSYLTVTYVIKPVKSETKDVNKQIDLKEADIKTTYYTVTSYKAKSETTSGIASALAALRSKFNSEESEDDYLDYVNSSIKACSLNVVSISASEGHMSSADFRDNEEMAEKVFKAVSGDETVKGASVLRRDRFNACYKTVISRDGRLETDILMTTITFELTGSYNNLVKFVKNVNPKGKNIICSEMTLDIPDNVSLNADTNPDARLMITFTFVNVPGMANICNIPEPKELTPYVFPNDIINGSYRKDVNLFTGFGLLFGK